MDPSSREIACTSTGYHRLSRRSVELTLAGGVLTVSEGDERRTISRAERRPIAWVGQNKVRPLVPLAGLVLDAPRGPWVVSTMDTTLDLAGAEQQATPHPHVWVSGEDLAAMAAACGLGATRKPVPEVQTKLPAVRPMQWVIGLVVLAGLATAIQIRGPAEPLDCSRQRAPVQELYPRMSCAEARAEVDRVIAGQAQPRSIVLRPMALTIDARDVVGPAKLGCDGLEFAVMDANQADPAAPIVYPPGPHAVLAGVLADGTLSRLQYVTCGNVVGREQRGPLPP